MEVVLEDKTSNVTSVKDSANYGSQTPSVQNSNEVENNEDLKAKNLQDNTVHYIEQSPHNPASHDTTQNLATELELGMQFENNLNETIVEVDLKPKKKRCTKKIRLCCSQNTCLVLNSILWLCILIYVCASGQQWQARLRQYPNNYFWPIG